LSERGARVAVVEAPLALYRRYRPETFSEVIGQDHVTVPLRNALSNNRVNHAYLFSGPRGCGKTTSARILARAINCEKGPIAEPCGVCKSCTDLARGGPGSIDVIEIDAASHGGVDDARDLRERAFFSPVESRYKIYIIDEAHMVTTQGFNALLKLVEEPPPHLKFIFATTEPEKVIGTIRSRTHHYPFRLVPPKALADYMATLCEAEGVTIEPAALPLVVRAGAGSVRDSLSVLDQLMGGATTDGVTYRLAVQLLGFTPDSLLDACVDGFAAHDSRAVFETIEKVIETGQDPKRFAEDLLRRLRDLVILSAVPNAVASGLIEAAEDQGERLQTQAAGIGPAELTRAADIVAAGLLEMRGATAPRLQLELICAKVLLPGADDSTNGIQARLDRMERRLTITGGAIPAGTPAAAAPTHQPQATQQSAPAAASAPGGAPAPQQTPVGGPPQAQEQPAAAAREQAAHSNAPAPATAQSNAQASTTPQSAAPASATAQASPPTSATAQSNASAPATAQSNPPASAAPQASAPAPVDNSGSRSGAWGAEPGADSVQGGPSQGASNGASAGGATAPGGGSGGGAPAGASAASSAAASAPVAGASAQGAPGRGPAAAGTSSGSVGLIDVRRLWPEILEAVKAKRRFAWIMLSQNAQVIAIDEQTLTLGLVNAGARESFARSGSDEILQQAMIDTIGLNRRIEAVVDPSSDPGAVAPAAPPPSSPPPSSWDAPANNSPAPGTTNAPAAGAGDGAAPQAPSAGPSNSMQTPGAQGAGTAGASTTGIAGGSSAGHGPGAPGGGNAPVGVTAGGNAPAAGGSGGHAPAAGGSGGNAPAGGGSGGNAPAGAVATAVRESEATAGGQAFGVQAAVVPAGGAQAVAVQEAPLATGQTGLQSDQQAGGPQAPAANPAQTEDRREQAASKRRAAEAVVAAEQSRRAAEVQVQEAPLTPEEEAEAVGDDDIVLEEDSRSHTDLLAETLGAQIISEESN
jgi:DNA polymerase-3 subunit gamma/tau